jgi:hypothetical protein
MTYMLCRNRVSDFRRWRRIFDSHAPAHRMAGLHLKGLWRGVGGHRDVFFLFEVRNMGKAKAFISAPQAGDAAKASGVIDGEYHFLRDGGASAYLRGK